MAPFHATNLTWWRQYVRRGANEWYSDWARASINVPAVRHSEHPDHGQFPVEPMLIAPSRHQATCPVAAGEGIEASGRLPIVAGFMVEEPGLYDTTCEFEG